MHDYNIWLDSSGGLKPHPNYPDNGSFNNIVFSAEYTLARILNGRFNREDEDSLKTHIQVMRDADGLYKPKNSHDNLTSLIVSRNMLRMPLPRFSLAMMKGANYHPKHIIVYAFLCGGPLLRNFARLFLIIPAIAMIYAASVKGKYRQEQWMINDGKILQLLKMSMLSSQSFLMRVTGRICKRILVKKYKEDYFANMLKHYFRLDHPCVKEWRLVDTEWLSKCEETCPQI